MTFVPYVPRLTLPGDKLGSAGGGTIPRKNLSQVTRAFHHHATSDGAYAGPVITGASNPQQKGSI